MQKVYGAFFILLYRKRLDCDEMKARMYKKHVIDGEKSMAAFTSNYIKNHRNHIALFVAALIFACLISAVVAISLARYTSIAPASVIMIPIIVHFLLPFVYQLVEEHRDIRQLKMDRNNYSDWMRLQEHKITSSDREDACRIVAKYRNTYLECHNELLQLLQEHLKQKPANQLIVSVIAGLIFLSNDTSDYKKLFDAKYRHGATGNMIPEIWIKILDPGNEDAKIHSDYAEDFLSFWDQINNSAK